MTAAGRPPDGTAPETQSATPRILATAAWGAALALIALIAFSALANTGDQVSSLAADTSGRALLRWLLGIGVYLLASLAAIGLARRAAVRNRLRGAALPLLIVGLAVGVRVVLAVVADAALRDETAIIHEQALGVLDGECCFSHRPLGYPIVLAGAYALFGVGTSTIEALNIVFAAVTAWLVWEIGRVTWGRPVAAMAATAYAIAPSQVLLSLVPLTEPMYTMLVAGTIRVGIMLESRPMLVAAAACAALLAAGQYVRATSVSLLAPIALLPVLFGWPLRRTLERAALIGGLLVVLLLPVVAYNLRSHGDFSLSTSAYGGWSLYVGANREHLGQWNAEDAARLAEFPGDSWWDRSEYAGRLAMDRVLEDPAGSLAMLPAKFALVWGNETYAATYALRAGSITREVQTGWLASQLFWTPLVFLAAVGMYGARRDPRPAAYLIGMTITLVALTHLALEAHSRYHAYLVPLFCLLAAAGAEALVLWWHERRPTLATS